MCVFLYLCVFVGEHECECMCECVRGWETLGGVRQARARVRKAGAQTWTRASGGPVSEAGGGRDRPGPQGRAPDAQETLASRSRVSRLPRGKEPSTKPLAKIVKITISLKLNF